MLKNFEKGAAADTFGTLDTDALKQRLAVLQQQIKALNIPVMIVFEGWGASGKGSMIAKLIANMDPRGFKVYNICERDKAEKRYHFLQRFWSKIPPYGNLAIFDRSWYREISALPLKEQRKAEKRIAEIKDFEAQLSNDGYVIIKLFLHISKKEQKSRLNALEDAQATRWRVTENDWRQNKNYQVHYDIFDNMLRQTNTPHAPWHIIDAAERKSTTKQIFSVIIRTLEEAIQKKESGNTAAPIPMQLVHDIDRVPVEHLAEINLSGKAPDDSLYSKELEAKQKRLFELQNEIYLKKIPVILAFEGWDAAGKGGNIKRIARALDPRGYEVIPVSAPTEQEKAHQYLWRFWNNLPKTGHIKIFDRTWYGRVLVERIEGFCSQSEWERAYDEINSFEKSLTEHGAIVLKFWLQIDKKEQLNRFSDRQNTLEKQWKITQEDWRNRERWPEYEVAADEMIQLTNTKSAPWTVVESNDKRYARIKTLDTIIKAMENRLQK